MKTAALPTVKAAQVLITNAARAHVNGGKISVEEVELALSYAKAEYPDLYEKIVAELETKNKLDLTDATKFVALPETWPGTSNSEG